MSFLKKLFRGGSNSSGSAKSGASSQFESLCDAIESRNLELVQTLITEKPTLISGKDDFGQTPLHLAVDSAAHAKKGADTNRCAIVEFLLASGSDVNAKNGEGNTPLHLAAFAGDTPLAQLLLSNKAKVNPKNRDGQTPLQIVAKEGNKSFAEVLRQHGEQDSSVALRLATVEIIESIRQGDYMKVKALAKEYPELVTKKGEHDWTLLHFAADNGQMAIADLLLSSKADVNARADDGVTPLHCTARSETRGRTEVAKVLIANKAKINAKDDNGQTPLHYAAFSHNHSMAALLAANKADCKIMDKNGQTPVDIARTKHHQDSDFRRVLSAGSEF